MGVGVVKGLTGLVGACREVGMVGNYFEVGMVIPWNFLLDHVIDLSPWQYTSGYYADRGVLYGGKNGTVVVGEYEGRGGSPWVVRVMYVGEPGFDNWYGKWVRLCVQHMPIGEVPPLLVHRDTSVREYARQRLASGE